MFHISLSPSTQTLLQRPITSVRSLPCSSRRCFALWWPCGTTWQIYTGKIQVLAQRLYSCYYSLSYQPCNSVESWQSSYQTLGDDLEDFQSVNTSLLPIFPANLEVSVALLCCLTCERWCRYEAFCCNKTQKNALFSKRVCLQSYWITHSICMYLQHKNFNKLIQQTDWIETTLPQNDQVACLLKICQAVKFLKKIRNMETSATLKSQQRGRSYEDQSILGRSIMKWQVCTRIHCPLESGWIRTNWSSAS